MKHIISTRWSTNPNQGHSHFPYNFWSLHEYLIHYQGVDSYAHLNDHIGPPPQLCCLLSLEWLTYFEHRIQSLSNTCLLVSILFMWYTTPNHITWKCKCSSNRIRVAYLRSAVHTRVTTRVITSCHIMWWWHDTGPKNVALDGGGGGGANNLPWGKISIVGE